ncbi:hypothetical protein BZG36_00420 [Bifiguratus adelaidae]|uniref:Glutamyl-tRNA(Gln) amidotransferase subunit B, mitochondrial n=1 Tax=Bifiguratus adelaidae TaxID=1938954 RepID=A0A261Y846_9FUNG|nr:hypothetical protein BZG36_00420 [Bifiguratus adelaidae]
MLKATWEAVVGLEVHAQLKTRSKLFSEEATPTSFNAPVNSRVSVIDAAFPGVQPSLNKACVDLAVKTALALKCKVHQKSCFDRKHYFYPDLPQGYQITQQYEPIATGGKIIVDTLDGLDHDLEVKIHQIQLEQDTGKSSRDLVPGHTLVDLNRAGTGLIEIVTKPDMRSSKEAGLVVKKLQSILRAVGSCDANMEEGSMRCDVNVSVRRFGEPFGVRCELKNLNSIRSLTDGIDAEVARQIELLESGQPVKQETRGFDVVRNKTFSLRSKETAPDYRYMPEPDLPPLLLSQDYIQTAADTLPELPDKTRDRLLNEYQLDRQAATVLLSHSDMIHYFDQVMASTTKDAKVVANWITHDLFGILSVRSIPLQRNPVSPTQLGSLCNVVGEKVSGKVAKSLLQRMVDGDSRTADEIIQSDGLALDLDEEAVRQVCQKIMQREPAKVAQSQKNQGVKKWFVGQVMRETRGKADARMVNRVVEGMLT